MDCSLWLYGQKRIIFRGYAGRHAASFHFFVRLIPEDRAVFAHARACTRGARNQQKCTRGACARVHFHGPRKSERTSGTSRMNFFMVPNSFVRCPSSYSLQFPLSAKSLLCKLIRLCLKSENRHTARSRGHQFVNSSIQFANSPIHQFTTSSVHQFTNSPIHQFTNSQIHQGRTNASMHR